MYGCGDSPGEAMRCWELEISKFWNFSCRKSVSFSHSKPADQFFKLTLFLQALMRALAGEQRYGGTPAFLWHPARANTSA
jgi:hypothetical protein